MEFTAHAISHTSKPPSLTTKLQSNFRTHLPPLTPTINYTLFPEQSINPKTIHLQTVDTPNTTTGTCRSTAHATVRRRYGPVNQRVCKWRHRRNCEGEQPFEGPGCRRVTGGRASVYTSACWGCCAERCNGETVEFRWGWRWWFSFERFVCHVKVSVE